MTRRAAARRRPPLDSVAAMTMRTRVAWAGAAVALSIGGLAACSSSQDVSVSAVGAGGPSAIQRASVKTVDVESVKFSLAVSASGIPGADGTATITADGAIDNANDRAQLTLDLSKAAAGLPGVAGAAIGSIGDGGRVQVVTQGSDAYVNVGSLASILGATSGQSWVKVSDEDHSAVSTGVSVASGSDILKLLGDAGNVTTVGPEEVRGVQTTHYRGTLDVAAAIKQLPADQQQQVSDRLSQLGIDPKSISFPVDVWIGEDDLVRRVQLGVDGSQLPGNEAKAVNATVTLEFYDFGAPVDITVPSPDQVFNFDLGMLKGLPGVSNLPGLGGS
jgi:hypothetical protein